MQISKNTRQKYALVPAKSKQLHSPDHVLADELSVKLGEPKRFGFYLKLATLYHHDYLRGIAGRVLESRAKKPGALFAYLLKKENQQKKLAQESEAKDSQAKADK